MANIFALLYRAIRNVPQNKILGRTSTGTGAAELIDCTAAGRALIDDADAAAQRTTLGLGTAATQASTAFDVAGSAAAVAATAVKETVASRGHMIDDIKDLPLVVVDEIQSLRKTRDVREVLMKLGVWPDIYRVVKRRGVRAGKGKMRGRRRKRAVGPLLVVTKDEGIVKAARNLPGVNIITVDSLNAELLAPGTHAGRLTVWTNSAIEQLDKLFGEK